jgi:predicted Zn-dependent protease
VALNKARTSIWVKTLIIILIIAFVSLFMYQGVAGIVELFKQPETAQTPNVDYVTALEQQNQPSVDALQQVARSNPTSFTAQVTLANKLYEWADQLSRPQQGQSQLTTAAMTAAFAKWGETKAAYDAAVKLMKGFDSATQTDRSYAMFQSGDTTAAIKLVTDVTKKEPSFAQGWAHLGMYLDATNQPTPGVVAAYKKYLALDPNGTNSPAIKKRVAEIAPSSTATKTPTTGKTP